MALLLLAIYAEEGDMGQRGISLIEIIVSISIVAVVATIAIPSFTEWKDNRALSEDVVMLKGYIQVARMVAIAKGYPVAISLNKPKKNQYLMFIDNGAGSGGKPRDGDCNGSEVILDKTGIAVSSATCDEPLERGFVKLGTKFDDEVVVPSVGFVDSGRRTIPSGGQQADIKLKNTSGREKKISVTTIGEVRVS